MVCQICGGGSGYYPLCLKHYNLFMKGDVAKCANCNTYFFKSEGCPTCIGSEKSAADEMMVRISLIEKWGKRLFVIALDGEEYSKNPHDDERYAAIKDMSSRMKSIWDSSSQSMVVLKRNRIEDWAGMLDEIANRGLQYSSDDFDVDRYVAVLDVAESLMGLLESYQIDIETETPQKTPLESRFVADQEIGTAWMDMIEKARDHIYLASPWIYGVDKFVNILSEVREKDRVTVRILVRPPDSGKETEHRTSVTRLNKLMFHVEKYERLHAKMLIIDDTEVYIGSANFIRSSEANAEAGICTTDSRIVKDATLYFEDKWDEAIEKKWS